MTKMAAMTIPYNGKFPRRQIFAVLSKKHGAYLSRILIFAVGNIREKVILIRVHKKKLLSGWQN